MDSHTLLTVAFVVLTAATLFVTARIGAVAIGVLPATPGTDDGTADARKTDHPPSAEADERRSTTRDDWEGSRMTVDDHERIRRHLEKDRFRRRPDDLLPSDDDRS